MTKSRRRSDGRSGCRLQSLPDELLQSILALVDHPSDRRSVALSCSRLRRLSRRTPHALRLHFVSLQDHVTAREWMRNFEKCSGVFTLITNLTVDMSAVFGDQLLAAIGAGCPRLERLKLQSTGDRFQIRVAAWRKLARLCPLLHSLELDCPNDRCSFNFSDPPPPPVDAFPSLHSLSLLYLPGHHRPLPLCSSLTSLSLWQPNSHTLFSLASSSSSFRTSLESLTIHSAGLEASLAFIASFPALSSLSLHSCRVNPFELISLSHSLHTLTHLTIHNCPSVSSHAVAALVQSNSALSSLSLHASSYRLFSAQGFRTLLHRGAPRLHSLHLAGLPSFRPAMLSHCSDLHSLTLVGREEDTGEFRSSLIPAQYHQRPSLTSLAVMLVKVVRKGQAMALEAEGREDTDASAPAEAAAAEAIAAEATEAEAIAAEATAMEATAAEATAMEATAAEATAMEATAAEVEGSVRFKAESRRYVDIRTEAAAVAADRHAAKDDVKESVLQAKWANNDAFSETSRARATHGEWALPSITTAVVKVRSAIAAWRSVGVAYREAEAALGIEGRLVVTYAAVKSSGFFAEEQDSEGMGEEGGGEGGVVGVVAGLPEEGLSAELVEVSERLLGEEQAGWRRTGSVSRGEALSLMDALMVKLHGQMSAVLASLETDGLPAAAPLVGDEAAAAGVTPVDVVAPPLESLTLESIHFSNSTSEPAWLNSTFPAASPPMFLVNPISVSSLSTRGSEAQLFKSIVLSAAFGKLKRLALIGCSGLKEKEMLILLLTCAVLEELRVEKSEALSDSVIARSRLAMLTGLSAVGCDGVTAVGVGGLLGNFPRLRRLTVEADKVSGRARRELLRAGVVVRGG